MRLIDADTLIKDLSYLYTKNRIPINMQARQTLSTIMKQPIAYDVDELLKQLEENFKPDIECFDYAEDYEYSLERYNRIIETIKRGKKEQ